jgi:trans-aconitate methyltransferase
VLLHYLVPPGTSCIIQLGCYLGKTTRFLVERAPDALVSR